ncbi:MAG: TetR/AcrR family transcriptional regulator, partial [Bacilli bacterium]
EKGYSQASTNLIAEKAQVSKGLIFKYFPKKSDLYLALFHKHLKEMVAELSLLSFNSQDPIDKIVDLIFWKVKYASEHEQATTLLLAALSDPPKVIAADIKASLTTLAGFSFHQFFDDIDYTRYERRFSKSQVQKNIELAIEGLQASVLKKGLTLEKLTAIKEESIQFLKIVLKGMED